MGKDIFISYRREGGEHLALLIYHQLRYDGYSVFLDVESLRKGKFDEALFERIREATDFILILPPKALDRCANSDDWVRQEIEFALREKKNIIPIMMEGFDSWPADLPETMMAVSKFNGLKNHQGYFSDLIRKLKNNFLQSSPRLRPTETEDLVEDPETLQKCPQCGSDSVTVLDSLTENVNTLRLLRGIIRCWVTLAPVILIVILTMSCLGAESIGELITLKPSLDDLLNARIENTEFFLNGVLQLTVSVATLLLIGNNTYRYTESNTIVEKETVSRYVTVTCKRCNTKRKVHVLAEVLPTQRREKEERILGYILGLMMLALLTPGCETVMELLSPETAAERFMPIVLILSLLVLISTVLINRICSYLNELPDKTMMNYLKKDFHFLETTQDLEEEEEKRKAYSRKK